MKIPEIEQLPSEQVEEIQSRELRHLVDYCYRNSPFYHSEFKKAGVNPHSINSIADLKKLPFTTKEDIRIRNWDFLCVKQKEVAEYVASSGTTGMPTFIGFTQNDLKRLTKNELLGFQCAGATKEDTFHITVTNDSMFVAGNAFYRGITELGATAIRFGPGNSLRQLMMLKSLKATGFVSVPSYLVTLGKAMSENGYSRTDFNLNKAVLVGESIRKEDFALNGLGKKISDLWRIDLFSTYGNTEMSTSLCECPEHKGGHLHPDLLILEIVDEKGNLLGPGEKGELVVTTLGAEAMPLIRYKTGDITFIQNEKCNCGRTSLRIGPILARKNHLLKVKGSNVYPAHIENALHEIPEIINYAIEAYTEDNFSDGVRLKIGTAAPTEELKKKIAEHVKAYARMTPAIDFLKPEEVRAILFKENERKPKIFHDMRQIK